MREPRGAGVPQRCRIRDNRRRELVSALGCRLGETGSGFGALPLNGAVDSGAADAEEVGDLGGAVLATVHQGDQVCFLTAVELGLLATQPTLRLGDLHALASAEPDQVGLELSHHRKNVEEQSADRVGRVIDRPAQTQADLPSGELIGDRTGVGQGPGQAVELGHHQGVTIPACGECLAEARSLAVGAGQAVIDVDPVGLDAEAGKGFALSGEVVLISGTTGVPDKQRAHGAPPGDGPGRIAERGRLGHRAEPDSASRHLQSCDRKARPPQRPWPAGAIQLSDALNYDRVMVILVTMTILSLAEVKSHLSELVGRVNSQHERVTVTVHGKPSAVLIAPEDLESLEETIAILSDPDTLSRLAASEAELARGEGESEERLAQAMNARRRQRA
jgi:antitoxin YefM